MSTAGALQIMVGGRIPVRIGDVAEVELLEMLGSGGYGTAWKVADRDTGQLYTLKIIQGIVPGSVDAERVRMEAEVSIPSSYIVHVIGLREWGSNTFLILFEYFPSRSLDKLLDEDILTGEQRKQIFKQTLLGVADAHRSNVIHRDLKPGNILVGKDGQAKLIDFGISKFKGRGEVTLSGVIIGTWPYIAPELITEVGAKAADARADIYSLGHLFYELVVGENFWAHKGWRELKDMITYLVQTPPPTELIELDDFHCDFYDNACEVLPRMVKIDPSERYHSVDDVLIGLCESETPYLSVTLPDLHLRHPLLIVESGSNQGARTMISLEDGGSLALGRTDIAGNDTSISRKHLEFGRSGNCYFVRDLHSKNGTILRGIALKPGGTMEIRHADRIKVGDVFLRFAFMREL